MTGQHGVRPVVGWLAVFLLAALSLRLPLILQGVSYDEDWHHPFFAHIESYRLFAALDLGVMQWLLGEQYLLTPLPRLLSGLWLAAAMATLAWYLRQLGSSWLLSGLCGIALLLHPAVNEFTTWGVLSSYCLALFLSLLGASVGLTTRNGSVRWGAITLLSIASTGYQLLMTVGLLVVLLLRVARFSRRQNFVPHATLTTQVLVVLAPVVTAVLTLSLLRFGLGIEDFAGRGIAFGDDVAAWLSGRFYVFSNAYANLYQGALGVLLGEQAAVSAFRPVLVMSALAAAIIGAYARGLYGAIVWAILSLAALVGVLAPLLATAATPTGYRVLLLVLYAQAALMVLLLQGCWHSLALRRVISVAAAALMLLLGVTSFSDMQIRRSAFEYDQALVSGYRNDQPPGSDSQCPPLAPQGIMVSYDLRSPADYSAWTSWALPAFLRVHDLDQAIAGPYLAGVCREKTQ